MEENNHYKPYQPDAQQLLADAVIKDFHEELDLMIMRRLADGRLVWDGTHLRDSSGAIIE